MSRLLLLLTLTIASAITQFSTAQQKGAFHIYTPVGSDPSCELVDSAAVFQGKLYLLYNTRGGFALGVLDGDDVHLIPNPDATTQGQGLQSYGIVFQGKMYFQYRQKNNLPALAEFDGSHFTLIPFPPNAYRNFTSDQQPFLYNGAIYCQLIQSDNHSKTAKFDGNKITLINLPGNDENGRLPFGFNGKLYFKTSLHFYAYDGTNFTLLGSPPIINTLEYHGKLYTGHGFPDAKGNNVLSWAAFDGTNFTKLSPPPSVSGAAWDMVGIFKDNLLVVFTTYSTGRKLIRYDGTAPVAIPGASIDIASLDNQGGINGKYPNAEYHDKLYLQWDYDLHPEQCKLFVYDGTTITQVTAAAAFQPGRMAVCYDKLYFNVSYNNRGQCIAAYDGQTVTLIAKESAQYNQGGLFEFGGKLYFKAAGKLIRYDGN